MRHSSISIECHKADCRILGAVMSSPIRPSAVILSVVFTYRYAACHHYTDCHDTKNIFQIPAATWRPIPAADPS